LHGNAGNDLQRYNDKRLLGLAADIWARLVAITPKKSVKRSAKLVEDYAEIEKSRTWCRSTSFCGCSFLVRADEVCHSVVFIGDRRRWRGGAGNNQYSASCVMR
jgi:hypothetical protein